MKVFWRRLLWSRKWPRRRKGALWKRLLIRVALAFVGLTLLPVLLFRVVNPTSTPLMWIRWAEGGFEEHFPRSVKRWRRLEEISPQIIQAVLTSEDQKFFTHHGFDWEALEHAIEVNPERRRKLGASTISMQTARNVFLWQGRTWLRKGLEAYFTVMIELLWGKERILEVYFNVIEWGDGVFGCDAAARRYFRMLPRHAGPMEAAWLAAILPSPRKWSRPRYSRLVERRRERILDLMPKIQLPPLAI